jgi:hypothetical protein
MLKDYYANYAEEDWKRYFTSYDRTSIDEQGKEIAHCNAVEEMYHMFMARRDHDKAQAAKERMALSKMEETLE